MNYIKINTLELMAEEYYTKSVPDSEIKEQDITKTFLRELPFILEGEVLSLGLTGKTNSSKSTLMMFLVAYIKGKYFGKELELTDICSDQYEFGRLIIDSKIRDTIVGIDEYGDMEETGYNATIESKYLEQFSNLQAQRKIARISCAPRKVFDINCSVVLKILSKDTSKFLTHALVYYKIESPNYSHLQLIGRVSFYIKDIMFDEDGWKQMKRENSKEWKEYKGMMEKSKTDKELQEEYGYNNEDGFFKYFLRKTKRKEFGEKGYGKYLRNIYHRYRKRKFKKMDLLNKEGVMQMREMTFAELYLEVFDMLKPLVSIMRVTKDIIESKANVALKKRKIPATLFTMEIIKTRVNSLVSQLNTLQIMKLKTVKCSDEEEKKELRHAIKESVKSLQEEINSLNRLVAINKEYTNI